VDKKVIKFFAFELAVPVRSFQVMAAKKPPVPVEGRPPSLVRRNKTGHVMIRLNSFVPLPAVEELEAFEKEDPRPRGIIVGEAIKHYIRAQRRRGGT
jgi:hypothetical protein